MALDFSTLTEASFRGTGFPVMNITEIGSQNMPQHKRADRDGARIEGTGLNPFQYAVKIPFLSTITPGPEAQWVNLFPETYFQMKEHFKNRSTGYFIHPLYGGIKVKPISWQADMTADTRSGIIVDIVFIETTEDENSIVNTSYQSSSVTQSSSLDSQLSNIVTPTSININSNIPSNVINYPKDINGNTQSFEDFVNSLISIVDKGTLTKNQFYSKIDSVINSLNKLKISTETIIKNTNPITQISTFSKIGNGNVNIYNTSTELALSLYDYKNKIIAQDKEVSLYIAPKITTIVDVAIKTKNSIEELNQLNDFNRSINIPQFTKVKYYTK